MRLKHALFSAILLLASLPAALAAPMLVRGRCHMGECSFTEIVNTKTVAARTGGALVAAKERSAVVKAPVKNGEPQYDEVQPPKFFGLIKVSYAFCSTERPAFVFYSDGKFYAHVLDVGDPSSVAGYNTDSHLLYWAICHQKVIRVDDLSSEALAKQAQDLGYHKVPEAEKGQYEFKNRRRMTRFFGLS
ncbi:MAG TPA: hypothetical protein VKT73_05880 [Xanthobacteraceae bacterium]|nr:hypothetical protein [Xanthobacteraceae bacterium]